LDVVVVCGSTKIVKKKVLLLLCTLVMVIFGVSYCLMAERLSQLFWGYWFGFVRAVNELVAMLH